jgi:F-type H+-transporting ATPase subunit b
MEHLLSDASFWVAVGFVLFMLAVFKPVTRAIGGGLDSRAGRIQAELDRAVALREEAEALLAQYQRQAEEAIAQADAMVAKADADAKNYIAQVEAELKANVEKRRQLAEQKIAQAESRAVADVQQHIADLACSNNK